MFLPPQKLEELPNIGKAIAADLRAIAITQPQQLAEREPLEVWQNRWHIATTLACFTHY